jgi:hypothetical protein
MPFPNRSFQEPCPCPHRQPRSHGSRTQENADVGALEIPVDQIADGRDEAEFLLVKRHDGLLQLPQGVPVKAPDPWIGIGVLRIGDDSEDEVGFSIGRRTNSRRKSQRQSNLQEISSSHIITLFAFILMGNGKNVVVADLDTSLNHHDNSISATTEKF